MPPTFSGVTKFYWTGEVLMLKNIIKFHLGGGVPGAGKAP